MRRTTPAWNTYRRPARVADMNGSRSATGALYPRYSDSTSSSPAKLRALRAKTNGMPHDPMTMPAIAGPIARATLTPIDDSEAASPMSGFGTTPGTKA